MLFRFFLISTLLLVGIKTVAIGAPVTETIESIKAIEIPQMGSSNLILNRRFINGLPGIPQCSNSDFPNLMFSKCLTSKAIEAICAGSDPRYTDTFEIPYLDDTLCMDFRTDDYGLPPFSEFSLCVKEKNIGNFNGEHQGRNGVMCKSFDINLVSEQETVLISVYDSNQNPLVVNNIEVHTENQDSQLTRYTDTFEIPYLDDTLCMDFRTDDYGLPPFSEFSLCVKEKNIGNFNGEHQGRNGVMCKSFDINLVSEQETVLISVYDSNQNPLVVNNIEVHTENQDRSMSDTSFYSIIINRVRRRRMRPVN
ncbi:hypothetical protein Glove_151g8 [Diversispora epigaea]|uniref:Uncharacterized protein n=1 Tax=Diversispora epigaea TaxID=1348612 RepID=A0A397IWM5_9GLOM|nr:hypothetical protein Glove_151g8 [Diversispora epigaea]